MTRKKPVSHQHSPRRRRRLTPKTIMLFRQVLFGLFLTVVCGGLFTSIWYGTRVEALTIDTVTVTGGETISHTMVETIATETLAGTYFRLVPRQFAWLYPETEIMSRIYELERVQTVVLTRVQGTELQIHITEYLPVALWCSEELTTMCYFIDNTGYAFTTAPALSGGAFVRYSTLGRKPERGMQLVPLNDLAAITWFYTTLKNELGWAVTQIEIDTVGDVFYTLKDKSELKVTLATDPAEAYANLVTILDSDSFVDLVPGDFQYIDLRFGNKVFVNREPWETFAEEAATSTFVWGELTAELVEMNAADNASITTEADEVLAVPLIEEADEAVLIAPTPEPIDTTDSVEDETDTPTSRDDEE